MDNLFAIAFPILPGKMEQFKQFLNELNDNRKDSYRQSRQKLNVRERVFLQQTPQGDMVIVTFTGDNPKEAAMHLGDADDEFNRWFKQQVKEIHALDLENPPVEGLPVLCVDTDGKQTVEAQ
jgi:hypothetical protein